MRVIGIDPSLRYTGVVILNDDYIERSVLLYSVKKVDVKNAEPIYVEDMYIGLDEYLPKLISKYNPTIAGVEIPFIPRNMGHLNKILILCGWIQHIIYKSQNGVSALFDVTVPQIRNHLNVFKNFKHNIRTKVKSLVVNADWTGKDSQHLYDATAVALTAMHMMNLK